MLCSLSTRPSCTSVSRICTPTHCPRESYRRVISINVRLRKYHRHGPLSLACHLSSNSGVKSCRQPLHPHMNRLEKAEQLTVSCARSRGGLLNLLEAAIMHLTNTNTGGEQWRHQLVWQARKLQEGSHFALVLTALQCRRNRGHVIRTRRPQQLLLNLQTLPDLQVAKPFQEL